jgi:drug/metabolite transporter (DMT)-like permease
MRTRLKADLSLLLVAVIWGTAFVAQRVAAVNFGPFLFNGSRFMVGGLLLLPLVRFRLKIDRERRKWVAAAGGLLTAAGFLQQAGLRWTTAGNAGFITSLYVVFVPVILLVVWRHQSRRQVWAAVALAAAGLFLLSGDGALQLAPGDGLELAAAVLWAGHVIVVGRAMRHMEALPFAAGQFLVAGALNLVLSLGLERAPLPGAATAWWALAYISIFSVAVGYTVQVAAQKHAPPTDAALILSLESVVALLSGMALLGEHLKAVQALGGGIMLAAILLAQIGPAPQPGGSPVPESAAED